MMTLEQAQDVRNSSGWIWVQKEIDYRISCLLHKLRTCHKDDLPALQDKINTYEEFRRLPDDVVDREVSPAGSSLPESGS